MGMCRNPKTWLVLGVVLVAAAVLAPGARAALLPVAAVALCPLSMLVMGAVAARAGRRDGDDRSTRVGGRGVREEVVQ